MGFDEALEEVRNALSQVAHRNNLSNKDIGDLLDMLKEEFPEGED